MQTIKSYTNSIQEEEELGEDVEETPRAIEPQFEASDEDEVSWTGERLRRALRRKSSGSLRAHCPLRARPLWSKRRESSLLSSGQATRWVWWVKSVPLSLRGRLKFPHRAAWGRPRSCRVCGGKYSRLGSPPAARITSANCHFTDLRKAVTFEGEGV
jgi:hypothetical protein